MASEKYEAVSPIEYQDAQGQTKTKWVKCGTGFITKSGSLMIYLDVAPLNGKLIIKKKEPYQPRNQGGGGQGNYDNRGGGRQENSYDGGEQANPQQTGFGDEVPF